MAVYEPCRSLSISTSTCSACHRRGIGTLLQPETEGGAPHFVCRFCDAAAFDIASEAQKEAYMDGANLSHREVH